MTERTLPDPPAGMRYVVGPPPEPPKRGWWLDPEDPSLMRYHDGRGWTQRTSSSTMAVEDAATSPSASTTLFSVLRGTGVGTKFYVLATLAIIVAVILVPWVAPALDRGSLAYQWTNRVGVFCVFGVITPLAFMTVIVSFTHAEELDSLVARFLFALMGPVALAIFTWLLWERLLEALWLR